MSAMNVHCNLCTVGTGTLTYAAFEQLLYGKWPEQDREDKIRNALKGICSM